MSKISLNQYIKDTNLELLENQKQIIIDGQETNYVATMDGDIISYQRNVKKPITLVPIIIERKDNNKNLETYDDKLLYRAVNLTINSVEKMYYVHRLIAETFIENPENKPQVNHKDGNKGNNDVTNLEWVTPSENIKAAYDIGLANGRKGSKHHNAKIDEDTAYEICVLLLYSNYTIQKIADKIGCTYTIVSKINKGQRWKHVSKQFKLSYSLYKNRKKNLTCSTTRERQILNKYK